MKAILEPKTTLIVKDDIKIRCPTHGVNLNIAQSFYEPIEELIKKWVINIFSVVVPIYSELSLWFTFHHHK